MDLVLIEVLCAPKENIPFKVRTGFRIISCRSSSWTFAPITPVTDREIHKHVILLKQFAFLYFLLTHLKLLLEILLN